MSETSVLNQDTATIKTDGYEEHVIGWTDEYDCERLCEDRNGILYTGKPPYAKAVGVVTEKQGWNSLAETRGGSILGNVRNTGWSFYDSREEWLKACDE